MFQTAHIKIVEKKTALVFSFFFLTWILLFFTGCSLTQEQRLVIDEANIDASVKEIRARVRELGVNSPKIIESASDQIISASDDPSIQRNALLWKIYAIPSIQRAAYYEDPVVAMLDLWVLAEQQIYFFEEGEGKDSFGPYQEIAIQAVKDMEKSVALAAYSMKKDAIRNKRPSPEEIHSLPIYKEVVNFATVEYPLKNLRFSRVSVSTVMPRRLEEQKKSFFSSITQLKADVEDIMSKVNNLVEYFPKQASWQTEILMDNSMIRLQKERKAIVDAIDIQRQMAFQDMNSLTTQTLDRVILEKDKALDLISQERQTISRDIDIMTKAAIQNSSVELSLLVNQIFLRLVQLVLIIATVVFIYLLFRKIIFNPNQKIMKSHE